MTHTTRACSERGRSWKRRKARGRSAATSAKMSAERCASAISASVSPSMICIGAAARVARASGPLRNKLLFSSVLRIWTIGPPIWRKERRRIRWPLEIMVRRRIEGKAASIDSRIRKAANRDDSNWEASWEPSVPEATATLWRYMSFAKFCSLLERKELFFSLVGDMEDRYEGFIYPPTSREHGDRLQQAEHLGHDVLREIARTAIN